MREASPHLPPPLTPPPPTSAPPPPPRPRPRRERLAESQGWAAVCLHCRFPPLCLCREYKLGHPGAIPWGPCAAVLFAWTSWRMGGKGPRLCAKVPKPSSRCIGLAVHRGPAGGRRASAERCEASRGLERRFTQSSFCLPLPQRWAGLTLCEGMMDLRHRTVAEFRASLFPEASLDWSVPFPSSFAHFNSLIGTREVHQLTKYPCSDTVRFGDRVLVDGLLAQKYHVYFMTFSITCLQKG